MELSSLQTDQEIKSNPEPNQITETNIPETKTSQAHNPERNDLETQISERLEPQTKSKNQLKKEAKQAKILATRTEKRAAERLKKKIKKSEKKSKSNETERNLIKKSYQLQTIFNAKIIFDCEFDELMTLKETVSLNSQLSYSYSANRKAQVRFENLICTSFNGKLQERMESHGNQQNRWTNFSFTSLSLEELIKDPNDQIESNQIQINPTNPNENQIQNPNLLIKKEHILYLTADSPNIITTLGPNKVYVIGAIVDHNRYKNLCCQKAEKLGINHARLPIGEYMKELKSRKVLTVNQVLEILLNWISDHDWRKSFELVIPQRKFEHSNE